MTDEEWMKEAEESLRTARCLGMSLIFVLVCLLIAFVFATICRADTVIPLRQDRYMSKIPVHFQGMPGSNKFVDTECALDSGASGMWVSTQMAQRLDTYKYAMQPMGYWFAFVPVYDVILGNKLIPVASPGIWTQLDGVMDCVIGLNQIWDKYVLLDYAKGEMRTGASLNDGSYLTQLMQCSDLGTRLRKKCGSKCRRVK